MLEIIITMAAFSILHSWSASTSLKQAIRRRTGDRIYEGFYRFVYNLFSIVTLAPVALVFFSIPHMIVWRVEGLASIMMGLIQVTGLLGLVVSLGHIDLLRFSGLRQIIVYYNGQALPLPPEPLQTNGLYRFVRHPLYLFSLMSIWPMAVMTTSWMAISITSTIYFVVGSVLEEKRLLAEYGEEYRRYQASVPWLIPCPKARS